MREDYSRAHVDGAEDIFAQIKDSKIDFNSPRIWGNILRYMFTCQTMERVGYRAGLKHVKVLDVGCSNGTFFGFANNNFGYSRIDSFEYIGVDVRQSSLDEAHRLHPNIVTVQLDMNDNALTDKITGQFDVINAQQVLEHIGYDDAIKMLKSCHDLLAPHGQLVLSAPSPRKDLGEEFISKATQGMHSQHGHIYEFSFDEVASALDDAGFKIDTHLGAMTRAMPRDLDNPSADEQPLFDLTRQFSRGMFVSLFSAANPVRSKNYLIAASKK